jgi:hypothetical protein
MADLKTPTTVTAEILMLCSMIPGSHPPPVHVPVRAVAGKFDHCVEIVDAVVQQHGGNRVNGWIIWQWPHTLVEAEFHAVWEKRTGELEDVSPKQDGEKRIPFLLFFQNRTSPFQRMQWFPACDWLCGSTT